jgi:hypothetical protein
MTLLYRTVRSISHLTLETHNLSQDMYKNAEKVLNDRDNISKSQVRSAVAKARIELNVRKINTMIHLIQPPSHDEVILPKNKGANDGDDGSPLDSEEMQKLRSEEQKMKIRLMKSAAQVPVDARVRPLDKRSIDRWVSKMNSAVEPYGDNKPRDSVQKRKKKEQLSQAAIHAVEKKLQMAIRGTCTVAVLCACVLGGSCVCLLFGCCVCILSDKALHTVKRSEVDAGSVVCLL